MARVIAVANQKGGVGKTTLTLNLGAALSERRREVLLVDLDPQGSLTVALGLNPASLDKTVYDALIGRATLAEVICRPKARIALAPTTIDLAGAEIELAAEIGRERVLLDLLQPVAAQFDYVLLDCPPSLGLLTINALTAAGQVIIPVQCQYLAFRGMQLLLKTIERVRRRSNPQLGVLGIVPTFYDVRTVHAREVLGELRTSFGEILIDRPVRFRVGLADAQVGGQSILEFARHSDIAETFRQIAEVIDHA